MTTLALTKDNFETVVSGNSMVIVDFWAPWCGPCRAFAPTFEHAADKHENVIFAKVNTDEEPEIGKAFNIRSIPTLMIFRDNVVIYSEAGALPPAGLENVLAKAKGLDMEEVMRQIAQQEGEKSAQSG
ncbi:MAG: thioredoxin [Betaproteobacteria bacterium]|nr:thioredoxin [Betaproteobacteria bacterium]